MCRGAQASDRQHAGFTIAQLCNTDFRLTFDISEELTPVAAFFYRNLLFQPSHANASGSSAAC